MIPADVVILAVICLATGAGITLIVCARWAWIAMGEGETVDTEARCIECGTRDVPLCDGECIPCRFGRDVPAGH